MNILDFGKFNLDNTLTQNKSLFDNYSNTNNGYADTKNTDFSNMIDKINSRAKTLEPENKIKLSDNKSSAKITNNVKNSNISTKNSDVTTKNTTVASQNTSVTTTNTKNVSTDTTVKSSNRDFASVTATADDYSNVKTAGIQYDTKVSDDNTSLVNEDLVSELNSLLSEYSETDEVSDLTDILTYAVDTDLLAEEISADVEIISDSLIDTEDIQTVDTEEIEDTEIIAEDDINVTENIAVDVQDILVKENLDNYSDIVSDKETSDASELVKDITETAGADTNKDLKNDDNQKENQSIFVKNNEDKTELKNDKVFVKDDTKTVQTDDNDDLISENQDLINLEETVEVSDAVKDMNVKTNTNKTSKDSVLENTKITKKDLEDLKVKIEEVSYEGNSGNNEFQSNQQTAQENLIKLSIDGMDNLTKMHKVETPNLNFAKVLNQTNTEELTQKNIVSQIYSKIQDMHQGSKMVMTLNPESLGKVQIEIVNSKTGLMAQMSVTNNAVKDILSKDLDGLRSALNAQGINVDSINVKIDESLNNTGKDDYLEQDKKKDNNEQGFSKNKKDEEEKKEQQKVFENLMDNIVKDSIKE